MVRAAITSLLILSSSASALELDALLDEVTVSAARVRAEQANVDVARAAVAVAGAMEDPTVSVMAEGLGRDMGPMFQYRFMQPLGSLVQRGPRKAVARAQMDQAQARSTRAVWDARTAAAQAFYELWRNHELEEILNRQLKILERMRISAQARYEAGMPRAHHAMLRAEAELATMEAEKAALTAERAAITALINALRGQPQEAELGVPSLPDRQALPSVAALVERTTGVPEVQGARAMVAEAEARQTVARRMYLPMPMAGVFVQQEPQQRTSSFGAEVALSVPLWFFDRQRNEVDMASAMRRAAEREQEAMRIMAEADLRLAWSRVRSADLALASLENTAIPKLRATVDSAEGAYRSGSEGFLDLLEAILALQRLEAERADRVLQRGIAWYDLARILGAPVTAAATATTTDGATP